MTEELEKLKHVIDKLEEKTTDEWIIKYTIKKNMNDTNPDIDKKLHELYSKLTPEERFGKMLSMCKTVRDIVSSQLPPGLSEIERKKKMFEIYYRRDFSEAEFEKLLKKLFP